MSSIPCLFSFDNFLVYSLFERAFQLIKFVGAIGHLARQLAAFILACDVQFDIKIALAHPRCCGANDLDRIGQPACKILANRQPGQILRYRTSADPGS
jgi:hypothetical protein